MNEIKETEKAKVLVKPGVTQEDINRFPSNPAEDNVCISCQ